MKIHTLAVLGLAMLTSSAIANPLNMLFTNSSSYASSNVWITLQRGQNPATTPTGANIPDAKYGANDFVWNTYTNDVGTNVQVGNLYAQSVRLSDIISNGGITWTGNAPSAAIFISYGTNLPVSSYSISGISPSATPDASYNIPYQNFELTYNGGTGDQGDITAINFYTASIGIKSYASADATGPVMQSAGFQSPSSTIQSQLSALTGNSPAAVITNNAGKVVRVLGPTQYGTGGFGPYPSFNDYFDSVAGLATNKTIIQNGSAYNTTSKPADSVSTYTNVEVTFTLNTNSVSGSSTNGYTLVSSGTIETVTMEQLWDGTTHVAQTPVTNTFNDISLIVNPNGLSGTNTPNPDVASLFVYFGDASPGADYIGVTGAGWDSFTNSMTGFVDGGGNPAASIVNAQILGELSAAFAAGFVGSTNTVPEFGSTPLGELPSSDWWNLTNVIAFEDVQSATNFFNTYANVIYQNSSNSVYGMVYSDRFIHNPTLVNSVQYNNTNVGSWLIDIGDPVGIPEPAAALLLLVGTVGFALTRTLRKRRHLLGS